MVAELVWPTVGYLPVTVANAPSITDDLVKAYFMMHGRRGGLKCTNSLTKGEKMLKGMCVKACSVLLLDGISYLSGLVKAEMRRNVSYWCKLSCNEMGEILNTECECPAGTAPHATCKHLACVAFMITECFKSNHVLIDRACTDSLQTFHQPARKNRGKNVMLYEHNSVQNM